MDEGKNGPHYVTCEECQGYRAAINEEEQKQELKMTRMDTELGIFKKLAWSILGVLVSGFAGTIFAVLSLK